MKIFFATLLTFSSALAFAAPGTYKVDPEHTYPHFETDHLGGLSVWRGMFKETSGQIVLDKEGKSGNVDIVINPASVDLGHAKLNAHVIGSDLLDVAKFPTATYKGKLVDFVNGAPTAVDGNFTLHGVTKPLRLKINSFKCMPHPLYKRELCGADAYGVFKRDDYGIDSGKSYGFKMDVTLRIQIEALKQD
ncbi:MAG: YceI family protein [Burkholderiaceae bacterium]